MSVKLKSFSKINLGLRIGPPGMRGDGFHDLRTIYQTIALHDTLKISTEKKGSGVEIRCKDARVPKDATNTCWKAAEKTKEALGFNGKVVIEIEKRLPVQGGLGAASGNAAATIIGIERALKKELPAAERLRIAEEVGSDVPLFLIGGTVLGVGRGEQVFPMPDLPQINLVIATPAVGVSTPAAFKAWDGLFSAFHGADALTVFGQSATLNEFSRAVYAWLAGSPKVSGVPARSRNRAEAQLLDLVRTGIENDFERVVFPQFPELRDVKQALVRAGAVSASLSGSGSSVFGIFRSRAEAAKAAKKLTKAGVPAQATVTLSRAEYWRKM